MIWDGRNPGTLMLKSMRWLCSMHWQDIMRMPFFLFLVLTDRFERQATGSFLDLMSSSPVSFFVPTLDIDLVWHTHQLMPTKYQQDCESYVGRFIDQLVRFSGFAAQQNNDRFFPQRR
jgi:hypothetical protein